MSDTLIESDDQSAQRRTLLASERTQLAWCRTGLTSFAVALGIGRLLPELAPASSRWPSIALGIAFAGYGIAFFLCGARRHAGVSTNGVREGHPLGLFAAVGTLLGVGTVLVILFS